nr:glycoside hydrolase family 99-like domain-containing protein [Clostridia bacterium]
QLPVLAWYFPNWHPDPLNDKWHGKGWTEWEVAKCARPRFEGHEQPNIPLWGYGDESDPKVMAQKIAAAMEHGIDGFLWDIYWFEELGQYRFGALDRGFFGAENNEQFKIALMWCNHDPIYVHPASRRHGQDPLGKGELTPQLIRTATDHYIRNYFGRPNYLRVDGKVYFVFWDIRKLMKGLGGVEGTRMVLDDFRRRVREAGLGELYLATEHTHVPGYAEGDRARFNEILKGCGFDGCVRYPWPLRKDLFPTEPYELFVEDGLKTFAYDTQISDLPMNITVSSGWDVSPRTVQSEVYENIGYPWSVVVTGSTPEKYEAALRAARDFAQSDAFTGHFVTLTTWNEWTEGNYLEPSVKYGYGYLEAVKRVFGERKRG